MQSAPRDLDLRLIADNDRFAAFFYREISRKLDAAARDQEEARFSPLLGARVRDVPLHPAVFIDADETIESAGADNARDQDSTRCSCATARASASADRQQSRQSGDPRAHADRRRASPAWRNTRSSRATSTISSSRALLRMTKHNKRRVAVVDNGEYVGVLEDIDLLELHRRQLADGRGAHRPRLDRDDLAAAAGAIERQVRMLRRQGVQGRSRRRDRLRPQPPPVRQAVRHDRFALDPRTRLPDRHGPEGRGEQTMRTDQDNGLILPEPVDEADLKAFRAAFTGALERFGFPPCPGERDGRQPAMVEDGRPTIEPTSPLARRARRARRR